MLIGVPGTRKSTAIKMAKKLLAATGYNKFSADKSSKEKFILDLAGDVDTEVKDLIDDNLWGEGNGSVAECYVACDEFNNFIGNGNLEFISLLGELWDYSGTYSNRIKNGKSVSVDNPTISILGGNTATGFSLAFPAQTIGQGFFSRLLLVYSDPSPRRITFPVRASDDDTKSMVDQLLEIKRIASSGTVTISSGAKLLLDKIYKADNRIDDVRFEHYANRRFTHLLKLTLIHCLGNFGLEISEEDVVIANTVLTHTEKLMPKALGEFGESKNAKVNHKIIQCLENARGVMNLADIWKHVSQDMDKMGDLGSIIGGLCIAGKVLKYENGFLIKRSAMEAEYSDTVDYGFLSEEEAGPMAQPVVTRPKLEVV